jgi:hypothetical protein
MRGFAIAVTLAFTLGCAGLSESIADMAGVDVQTGPDAVMPADFPLPPPPGAERPASVVKTNQAGKASTIVSYQVDDLGPSEAFYAAWFAEQGIEPRVNEQSMLGTSNKVYTSPDGAAIVTLVNSAGQLTVTLMAVE